MNLGERLRQLRESRGWNQKQLAAAADVHPSIISLMERNSRNGARPDTLVKLAGALGVTVGHLLGEESTDGQALVREDVNTYQVDGLEPYRSAINLAREHGLGPEELIQLIRTAIGNTKK